MLENKVTFQANGILFTRKFGSIELVSLIPWRCIAIVIREEVR